MFFGMLKHYMPRSLYGRAALILLLPVISLQLVVSIVFIQRHFEGVTEQMTQSVQLDLAFLTQAVENAPDLVTAQRDGQALAGPLELEITLPAQPMPTADMRRFYDFSGLVVMRTLRAELSELRIVDLPDDRDIALWFDTRHGTMLVEFARARVSASNPHQLLVLMVVLGVILTMIAFVYLRNQLRPIKRLAAASSDYGKGRVVPYTPSGATEVRAAGAAFLDMRNRIERQTAARTMMLSGVSHDLRTPLTRLRLGLSLLDDPDDAAPLIRDVDDMQRLLDGFLDFARGDAGDENDVVNPAALLEQVIADAQRMGQAAYLGALDGVEPAQVVSLGPMAIRRASENLIGNALRYGTRCEVSLALSDRAIRFSVEDNGPGIPAAQRDEALRPFARLDPARNQDQGTGVGLGLAIVADIARNHGGALRLNNSARLGGLRADLVLAR